MWKNDEQNGLFLHQLLGLLMVLYSKHVAVVKAIWVGIESEMTINKKGWCFVTHSFNGPSPHHHHHQIDSWRLFTTTAFGSSTDWCGQINNLEFFLTHHPNLYSSICPHCLTFWDKKRQYIKIHRSSNTANCLLSLKNSTAPKWLGNLTNIERRLIDEAGNIFCFQECSPHFGRHIYVIRAWVKLIWSRKISGRSKEDGHMGRKKFHMVVNW